MNTFKRLAALGAIATLLVLSGTGCVVVPRDHGPYNYDHGDRVDRDGHREARWCDRHRDDDEHCR